MSVYNYNTLTRANDGNTFEFNTNCNVLYVDELPSGVTLSLAIDNQNNPAITLRPKTQLRFKQNDRLFFTPSAATAGTIRIFLFLDESNLLEFDQSQYSSESTISGTVDIDIVGQTGADPLNVNISSQTGQDPVHDDIVEIGGSTTPVTEWTNILQANNPDATRIIKWTYLNTSASNVIYTVPTGNTLYITNAWITIFGLSNLDSGGILMHRDSTPTDIGTLLQIGMQDVSGTFGYSTSYPIPYKLEEDHDLELQGDSNSWTATGITGILI